MEVIGLNNANSFLFPN